MIYRVTNMSCMHCVKRIEEQLKKHEVTAMVDLASQSVTSDDKRVPELLDLIGYKVAK